MIEFNCDETEKKRGDRIKFSKTSCVSPKSRLTSMLNMFIGEPARIREESVKGLIYLRDQSRVVVMVGRSICHPR